MFPFCNDPLDSLILCRVFKAPGVVEKKRQKWKEANEMLEPIDLFINSPQEVGMIRVKFSQEQMRHLSSTQDPCMIYLLNLVSFG